MLSFYPFLSHINCIFNTNLSAPKYIYPSLSLKLHSSALRACLLLLAALSQGFVVFIHLKRVFPMSYGQNLINLDLIPQLLHNPVLIRSAMKKWIHGSNAMLRVYKLFHPIYQRFN